MRKDYKRIKKIPILDLKREYLFLKKDIDRKIKKASLHQQWILGKEVKELEERLADYLKVKYTIGVNSGTDAILISLRSLALRIAGKEFFDAEDEVITPAFTFLATTEAIVRAGAYPKFVDISLSNFCIEPQAVESAITKNTKGIVIVHLYGFSSPLDRILKIAKKYDLFVVEDSAQALGTEFKGKKLGSFGDIGAFSFFPSKNLGGYGDGGLIATDSKMLARLAFILRNHGQIRKYDAEFLGYNSRLDTIQACVLLAKINYIDKFNELRRKIAEIYTEELSKIKDIALPSLENQKPVYHLYPIRLSSRNIRDSLLRFLNLKGVEARVYYPKPIYDMKAYRRFKERPLKNTEEATSKVLCLPIHPFLKKEEAFYVVEKIKKFFKG